MTIDEALDVTRIYSVADQLPADTPLVQNRPFRAPHHTISHAGLVGGGNWPHPGEISLAHRGVLCQERSCQPVELSHAQQEIGLFFLHSLDAGEVTVELVGQLDCLGISYQCIGALALHRPKIQWYQERLGDCVQIADRMCGHPAILFRQPI